MWMLAFLVLLSTGLVQAEGNFSEIRSSFSIFRSLCLLFLCAYDFWRRHNLRHSSIKEWFRSISNTLFRGWQLFLYLRRMPSLSSHYNHKWVYRVWRYCKQKCLSWWKFLSLRDREGRQVHRMCVSVNFFFVEIKLHSPHSYLDIFKREDPSG